MNQNLSQVLMPLAILGPLLGGIVMLTRTLTNYYLRKRMVEKGYVDEDSVAILSRNQSENNKLTTLKWGLVVFFGGLGLIILEYLQYGPESPLPYGVFALSISLGFLIHYYYLQRNLKA